MNEKKSLFEMMNPKQAFVFGIVEGVLVLCTIGFFILLLGGVDMSSSSNERTVRTGDTDAAVPTVAAPSNVTIPEVTKDDHIRGNKDAEITIVEYSDIECPFCSRYHDTMKQIIDLYGDDVRWVYRHFPLDQLHPNARPVAIASECAAEQGAFWEFVDLASTRQGNLNESGIQQVAEDIDLNISKFLSNFYSGSAAYSLTWANGNHSQTSTANDESLREFPLAWDTRHNFSFNFTFMVGAGEEFYIPFTEAVLPLHDFSVNFLYNLSSGSPYTPVDENDNLSLDTNSVFKPFTASANLKFTKNFALGKNMKLRFYANIANLFNKDNYVNVYAKTGDPFDSGADLDFDHDGFIDPTTSSVYGARDRNPANITAGRTFTFGLTYIW